MYSKHDEDLLEKMIEKDVAYLEDVLQLYDHAPALPGMEPSKFIENLKREASESLEQPHVKMYQTRQSTLRVMDAAGLESFREVIDLTSEDTDRAMDDDLDGRQTKKQKASPKKIKEVARIYVPKIYEAKADFRILAERYPDGSHMYLDLKNGRKSFVPPGGEHHIVSDGEIYISRTATVGTVHAEMSHDQDWRVWGEIPEIPSGTWVSKRQEFHESFVHRRNQKGMSGDPEGGLFSVTISESFPDDCDLGYAFTDSGESTKPEMRHPQTSRKMGKNHVKQVRPHRLEGGNLALLNSCKNGKPIRVIRGWGGRQPWAPRKGFRYDGLYTCCRVWEEMGIYGFPIFRFAFVRIPGQQQINREAGPGSWTEEEFGLKQEKLRLAMKNGQAVPCPELRRNGLYWQIDQIIDSKLLDSGEMLYLIHWEGYPDQYDSWESESKVSRVPGLLAEYLSNSPNCPLFKRPKIPGGKLIMEKVLV